jgi:hypothetical protein
MSEERELRTRTNMMGETTSTMKPMMTTSKTMRYIMESIPNTSHQRWGEVCRHVLTEVYSKMWAVKNQLRVNNEERTERLEQEVGGEHEGRLL